MAGPRLRRPELSANALILLVALFLVAAANARTWSIVGQAGMGAATHAAVGLALLALTTLLLAPLGVPRLLRPGLIAVLLLSAAASHFTTRFGAVIDRHAIASVFGTDTREAMEWLSPRLALDVLLLGVLPSILVTWTRVRFRSAGKEALHRLALLAGCGLGLALAVGLQGRELASLLRGRMELRHVANPYALVAASLSYARHQRDDHRPLQPLGQDARHAARHPGDRPTVIVVVIGESARAASFALDGYGRNTTPELRRLPLVNFRHVTSCGTNTATSLPCMFSILGRAHYDESAARHSENVLDVLRHAGFDVVWLDNNTGSKGLAARGREVALAAAHERAWCHDDGCWDGILVEHLEALLPTLRRDTVVVLHMLGSHGPAYYERYPPAFARFTPECRVNELQRCTRDQIVNTYDNTIAYTDHVLAGAIRTLAAAPRVDGLLWFVSDHGESTGESGLYLHGAPYVIAPDQQTHVPMMMWASPQFATAHGLDRACVDARADDVVSHDHLSHTLMGLAEVSTSVYRRDLDLMAGCLRGR
ncbi:phosphoethanolamine transferase [Lysobacter humi (ex Lee et al. 2017)]